MTTMTQKTDDDQKLERYQTTLENLRAKDADPKVLKMWEGRIKKLQGRMESVDPDADEIGDDEMTSKAATKTAKAARSGDPTSDEKGRKGTLYCLCGCGNANNPGSRFSPGHDARLKGIISRLVAGTPREGDAIPQVAVDAANENGELTVAQYTATDILGLATGGAMGAAPKKAARKSKKA